ncbi:MAG: hypothetical protein ACRDV3_03705 [Acidothermaceae bacterium]
MLTTVRDRIGASTGALFVGLILIGNQMNVAGTDQSAHASGANVLRGAIHQAGSTTAKIGLALEVLGFVAFIAFLGYLADLWRRHSRGGGNNLAPGAAIVAGITMLAIKLGSGAPMLALYIDRKTLSPDVAQVLNDLGSAAFIVSWLPYAAFVAAAAFALRRTSLVGRPTTYVGAFIGIAGIALALVGFNDPVNANPAAFVLGLVWTLVVSVRLAVRPGIADTSEIMPDDAAQPTPVTVGA